MVNGTVDTIVGIIPIFIAVELVKQVTPKQGKDLSIVKPTNIF